MSESQSKPKKSRRHFLVRALQTGATFLIPENVFAQVPFAFFKKLTGTTTTSLSPGKLFVWGSASGGIFGNSSGTSRSSPVQVGSLTTWTKVSVGQSHAIALSGGGLFGWGYNNKGQMGNGTTTSRSSPVQVGTATDWGDVATAGEIPNNNHSSFAIKTSGTLWAWGSNSISQLGDGTTTDRSSPVQVGTDSTWSQVSASMGSSGPVIGAVKADGSLWMWGDNGLNQIGPLPHKVIYSGWSSLSISSGFSVGLQTDGTLWTWGDNSGGQLGNGNTTSRALPTKVGAVTTWRSISAHGQTSTPTSSFVVATRTDNTLWTWGDNTYGELGDGTVTSRSTPGQIGIAEWASASAGGDLFDSHFVQALKTDGTRWVWGTDSTGQLGVSLTQPTKLNNNLWLKVCAGTSHAVAIRSDGTLWGWGYAGAGQLGLSTGFNYVFSPTQIGTATWSDVSVSCDQLTMGIQTDGTLWGCGYSTSGGLGNGSTSATSMTKIGTLTNWKSIATSEESTYAIKTDGTLWAWGNNNAGQLGIGTTASKSSPVQVGTLTDWSKVCAGQSFALAVKSDGTLWSWGYGAYGSLGNGTTTNQSSPIQIGSLTTWSSVAAGRAVVLARRTDGTLWAWGSSSYGALGLGPSVSAKSSPTQIGTATNWSDSIAVGSQETFDSPIAAAIKTDGTLWTWGSNTYGNLGLGHYTSVSSPVQVGTATNWSSVYASGRTLFAINGDQNLWACGEGMFSKLGLDLTKPTATDSSTWSMVSAGSEHCLGIKTDGTLWAWGRSNRGQTALAVYYTSVPTKIGTSTWTTVFAGTITSAGIRSDGTLWMWGDSSNGEVGNGATGQYSSPIQLGTATDWSKVVIGTGGYWGNPSHVFAIKTNGTLWAWGSNTYGELGDGTTTNRSSPVQIGTATNWTAISASSSTNQAHSGAINSLGELHMWGTGRSGECGIYDVSPIDGGVNWKSVSIGHRHTMALKTDGTLWGWGKNSAGEVGNGIATACLSPVQIGGANWASVSAGDSYTLAVKTDGTLWAWGNNGYGQLGDGTTTYRPSPVQIGTLTNWATVAASRVDARGLACAVKTDGTLWVWGYGGNGLGDGTTNNTSSPIQIGTATAWLNVFNNGRTTFATRT